jgi:transducin (beta)-like 1
MTAATLDVDWRDATSFASCSSDTKIYVCQLGRTKPLMCFEGHEVRIHKLVCVLSPLYFVNSLFY